MIHAALAHLLGASPEPEPLDGVEAWWRAHRAATDGLPDSYSRALVGGFTADRLGWAFASGYESALGRLVPTTVGTRTALCATEASPGAHPRSIATRYDAGAAGGECRVSGQKGFVTLGTHAERLLVVATEGEGEDGRPRLVVLSLPRDREGVTVVPMAETPFVPEVPHARLELADVRVLPEERLPGDGYADYLKPFRTTEDIHVYGALLGHLLQVARRAGFAESARDDLLALACAMAPLAEAPPLDPAVHVALGAVQARSATVIGGLGSEWDKAEPEVRARWERDRALLSIAGKARAKRLEAARAALSARAAP